MLITANAIFAQLIAKETLPWPDPNTGDSSEWEYVSMEIPYPVLVAYLAPLRTTPRMEMRFLGMSTDWRHMTRSCDSIQSKHAVASLLNLTRIVRVIIAYSVWVTSTITGSIACLLGILSYARSLSNLVSSQCWYSYWKKSAKRRLRSHS